MGGVPCRAFSSSREWRRHAQTGSEAGNEHARRRQAAHYQCRHPWVRRWSHGRSTPAQAGVTRAVRITPTRETVHGQGQWHEGGLKRQRFSRTIGCPRFLSILIKPMEPKNSASEYSLMVDGRPVMYTWPAGAATTEKSGIANTLSLTPGSPVQHAFASTHTHTSTHTRGKTACQCSTCSGATGEQESHAPSRGRWDAAPPPRPYMTAAEHSRCTQAVEGGATTHGDEMQTAAATND